MSLRLAILIGINKYPNSTNCLRGCINDVNNWSKILKEKFGYSFETILDEKATKKNVVDHLENLIYDSQEGDSLVLQFSGHGTQISTSDSKEADGFCEAICLYDKYLIDIEIEKILSKLKPNISLTIISDSCFSGNLTRNFNSDIKPRCAQPFPLPIIKPTKRKRMFRIEDNQEKMNHILYSGCAENETSADACFNGIYEGAFSHYAIKVLSNGNFTNDSFFEELKKYIPSNLYPQHPQLECSTILRNKNVFNV